MRAIVWLTSLFVSCSAVASAQTLGDALSLEAFIDGIMAAQQRAHHLPAATISIVQDGEILFSKGYGYADRAARRPVDAATTLFRPGSISKLFTWTAVMQLVEQGRLDLDADVNDYLRTFQIPATYPEPITMKHLMTHTPGFEDGGVGFLFIRTAEEIVPLADSLKAHIPRRVRPPGTYSSYSNFAAALAGLIVENISGMRFAEYVEQNIFAPLGMEHSTFREPLPERLAPDMALGYRREEGIFEEGHFELISNFGPAGALTSTATDMARFMIAHLDKGRFGDARILREETVDQMRGQIYTLDPRLPGMAHGFYESSIGGQHIIGHGGDTGFFHSDMALFPDHGVGVFVSYVTGGGRARVELMEAFVERFFPTPDMPPPEIPTDFAERGSRFAGSYRFTRHNWSTIEKLLALSQNISVSVTAGNTLMLSGLTEEPTQWAEVAPLLFRQIDGSHTIAFEENADGKIDHMFFDFLPFMPTYRVAFYETLDFTMALVAVALFLSVTTLSGFIRYRRQDKKQNASMRWAVRLAALVALLTLTFFFVAAQIVGSTGEDLFYGIPSSLALALTLPHVVAVLTCGLAGFLVLAWKDRYWGLRRRLHYTLFTFANIGLVWLYAHWNVLGFRY